MAEVRKPGKTYYYDGAVMIFGKVVAQKFFARTTACSEKKALSNIAFQYKKKEKLSSHALIELDPKKLVQRG